MHSDESVNANENNLVDAGAIEEKPIFDYSILEISLNGNQDSIKKILDSTIHKFKIQIDDFDKLIEMKNSKEIQKVVLAMGEAAGNIGAEQLKYLLGDLHLVAQKNPHIEFQKYLKEIKNLIEIFEGEIKNHPFAFIEEKNTPPLPIFDIEVLKLMVGDNLPFIHQLSMQFLEANKDHFESLKTFIQNKNEEETQRRAHKLRGGAATIGALALKDLFEAIEKLSQESEWEQIEIKYSQVPSQIKNLEEVLEQMEKNL